jgi:hypothetical protein
MPLQVTYFKTKYNKGLYKPDVLSPFPETAFFNFRGRTSWNGTGSFCGILAKKLQFNLILILIHNILGKKQKKCFITLCRNFKRFGNVDLVL